MPKAQWPIALLLLVLSASQHAATPLPHEAYIWQRQWTPSLSEAIDASRQVFTGYRVLAAETDRDGTLQPLFAADLAGALARERVPVTLVFRLDGSTPPPHAAALSARITELAARWRGAGIAPAGIEIDHDCATARLGAYARLLHDVRRDLPPGLRLSITALPAWIDAAELPAVRAAADESVLQVHAVRAPRSGLFDHDAARRWIDAYAALSGRPFRVALPAYGLRVSFDARGKPVAAQAEAPRDLGDADVRELRAAPQDVAALLASLAQAPPRGLAGVVWFRLPKDDDRRAWSAPTLRAVITGAALATHLEAFVETAADGATDVVLANRGTLDAALAPVVVRGSGCTAADGANGYRAQQDAGAWRLQPPAQSWLRAGFSRRVGWIHCGNVEDVYVDEAS